MKPTILLLFILIYVTNASSAQNQLSYNMECRKGKVWIVLFNHSQDTVKLPRLDSESIRTNPVLNDTYDIKNDTMVLCCFNPVPYDACGNMTFRITGARVKAGIAPGKYYRFRMNIPEACSPKPITTFMIETDQKLPPMGRDEKLKVRGKENWEIAY